METVVLLLFKVFVQGQIPTLLELLCLKHIVLFVHTTTSISASPCFLGNLGGEFSFQL